MTSFCNIVIDACPRPQLARTLLFARELSDAFGSRVTGISCVWPRRSATAVALASALSSQTEVHSMEHALRASRIIFDEVFAGGNAGSEWFSGISDPVTAMRRHLLTADLLITDVPGEGAYLQPDPAALAIECGTAVLRLGKKLPARFSKVVVAWKDSPQARRAMHEALPILKVAERVTVIGVGDEVTEERLAAVVVHLGCHNVKAHYRHVPKEHDGVCSTLQQAARHEGASLIVSGLYGRSSMAERILGGVSKEMMAGIEISWLMAH